MKTKVFEPGAICAAVALLFVFALPAYAKSGGSTSAHTRVGKTSATSAKATQSGTAQKSKTSGRASAKGYIYMSLGEPP
jgi:hypothetical protein